MDKGRNMPQVTVRTTLSARLLNKLAAVVSLALISLFTQSATAQALPDALSIRKNFFVTGDYVVGGVGLRDASLADGADFAVGFIKMGALPSNTVPKGADIVAAFLYWETIEKDRSAFKGQNGFFRDYAIKGQPLGNLTAPPCWSSGHICPW